MFLRLKQSPLYPHFTEWAATLWLMAYVLMKFKTVQITLEGYGVNAYIFLALDAGTIPTYVWGTSMVIRRLMKKELGLKTTVWALCALLSFLTPYLYLFLAGRNQFPPHVMWGVIGIVSLMLAISIYQLLRKIR